jgi:primosomal protein N' (replication factor Y)
MIVIQALLPLPNVPLLYYYYCQTDSITQGDLVLVPFRKKQVCAIVWQVNPSDAYKGDLKQVISKFSYSLAVTFLNFIQKAKNYYLADLGSIAKMALPVEIDDKCPALIQDIPSALNLSDLCDEQARALHDINNTSKPILLYGVTGSGKTEVYFHLIADVISKGLQALIILPEIALTQQITSRFEGRFGFEAALWHSSITNTKKKKTFKGIIQGSVKVIIGARSSLFLPYNNLGLIIVDEEHDKSYKQESSIHYNARDMAILRGHMLGSKVILASATPSIESYYNHKQNKYSMVRLLSRHGNATHPNIRIVDMKQQKLAKNHWISTELQQKMQQYLDAKQQVLLFLNRKGYAPLLLCKSCGFKINCLYCSTSLVWHKSKNRLECHACGFYTKLFKSCPECKKLDPFIACGPGVERLYEEVMSLFSTYRVLIISKDQMSNIKEISAILDKITNYEVDIIIGTQIIAKGYHFPKLNLVGVVDADIGLSSCDLKSDEMTFQILQQVSGRAGRETSGEVLLQTYQKSAEVLNYIAANDYQGFIEYELQNKQLANLPPISKIAILMITATSEIKAAEVAKNIITKAPRSNGIKVLGPAPALLTKLKGRYRYHILVTCNKALDMQNYLSIWLGNCSVPSYATLKINIDPYGFM